ncbi:MAG: Zn-dependent hydrolase [Magnetococcales bacterium]|nr:Zn-dependent hydrolase [Magnetococcales bacterium]NGZ04896.1 Zn-dependent hydrolase [Magnetococcales bacterium]
MARFGLRSLVWSGCLVVLLLCPFTGWADDSSVEAQLRRYVTVPLEADLSGLDQAEQQMLPLLADAARAMDAVFWQQSLGDPELLFAIPWTMAMRQLLAIHFGPWDRMENNRPLLTGIAHKPEGARFYPPDVTRAALERAVQMQPALKDPYTVVRRDAAGGLTALPYHQAYAPWHQRAADRLHKAAALSTDPALARYLTLRAEALLNDQYRASDQAWMEMKENRLDLIIGPIETYEDGLLGVKTAHEGLLLIKDRVWERRLARQTARLATYQARLPVPEIYRAEQPGAESDLGVYDVLLMTGDAAATRPIAINLPNDEQVQLEKGSRRLQLRNAMHAKFDKILLPIARLLLDPEQLCRVTFEALFVNTLFHEVAHGLGIKKTISGVHESGTVNDALKEDAWMMEEGKADALALWLGDQDGQLEAHDPGPDVEVIPQENRYLTEFVSILRAIRFGPGSAHARANLIRFNFLREAGAFERDDWGYYRVNIPRMRVASQELARRILMVQGNGDLAGVRELERHFGVLTADLLVDLRRIEEQTIPVDVVFQPVRSRLLGGQSDEVSQTQ